MRGGDINNLSTLSNQTLEGLTTLEINAADAGKDLEKITKEWEEIEAEAAALSRTDTCPQPSGEKRRLPLPEAASATCEDTILTESGHACSYTTQCLTPGGRKKRRG